jgi:cytosine/adenosine deaminase-related metal-dependent hydrolase
MQIPFALGTDNLMSSSPDLFTEMEFAAREILFQSQGKMPVSPEKILQAVTINPARMAGLSHTGLLEEGYRADILLLKKDLYLDPFQGVYSILFRAGIQHIEWIVLSGKPIRRSEL